MSDCIRSKQPCSSRSWCWPDSCDSDLSSFVASWTQTSLSKCTGSISFASSTLHFGGLEYNCLWGVHIVFFVSEHERCLVGIQSHPCNGDGEQTSDLLAPWLGGLFTTPSSILPFAKSTIADAASVAEYIRYVFENWDGTQSPWIN